MMLTLIFAFKDTNLYVHTVTLSEKYIKNYQSCLEKYWKNLFIRMNIKQKVRIKLQQMNIDIFENQTLLDLIDCFVSVYLIDDVKRLKTLTYYLPKTIIKNYSNITNVRKVL